MKTWKEVSPYTGIEEDAPANQAGSGNIAGLGVDHPDRPGSGEPGMPVRKKKKKKEKLPLFGSKFIEDWMLNFLFTSCSIFGLIGGWKLYQNK